MHMRIPMFTLLLLLTLASCDDTDESPSHDDHASRDDAGTTVAGTGGGGVAGSGGADGGTGGDDASGSSDVGTGASGDGAGTGAHDPLDAGQPPLTDAAVQDPTTTPDAGNHAPVPEGACRSHVPAATSGNQTIALCTLESGQAQHLRVEGMATGAGHNSAQLLLGFDAMPTNAQATLEADQFKLMLYSGTSDTLYAYFGEVSVAFQDPDFDSSASHTLCFDLHDGSDIAPPFLSVWVDGMHGADCHDATTLTPDTAFGMETDWEGSTGAVAKARGAYYYQAGGISATPAITLFPRGAASCETHWEANSEWQRLCEPMTGARHFRIEQVGSEENNRYFYLVVGEVGQPEGNPTSDDDDGKLILTGGQANSGASWTWFRFSGESTTQFTFENEAGALYTAGPTSVCADLTTDAEDRAELVFWASGAHEADCADPHSLQRERALHAQSWDGPLVTGGRNFIKTNNAGIHLTRVVVSSSPRAR